jgi:hypothetical protein
MSLTIQSLMLAFLIAGGCFDQALAVNSSAASTISTPEDTGNAAEYVMGSCHFRIANMFGGRFEINMDSGPPSGMYYIPGHGPLSSWSVHGFTLVCVKPGETVDQLGIKEVNGEWLRYSYLDDSLTPFDKRQNAEIMPLQGVNATGMAVALDETTGPLRHRRRMLTFCLADTTQGVCGTAPVSYLMQPKANELGRVKEILQSIEFIDRAGLSVEDPGNPASSSAPINKGRE